MQNHLIWVVPPPLRSRGILRVLAEYFRRRAAVSMVPASGVGQARLFGPAGRDTTSPVRAEGRSGLQGGEPLEQPPRAGHSRHARNALELRHILSHVHGGAEELG